MRFWLLLSGVVAPAIYVALAMAGPLLWPGYDLSTRMISELGMAEAPMNAVFNAGLMVAGSLAVIFSLGLFGELRRRGADGLTAGLAGLTVAVFGGSLWWSAACSPCLTSGIWPGAPASRCRSRRC